jgi:methanogenic corrinoid protein MtbC1
MAEDSPSHIAAAVRRHLGEAAALDGADRRPEYRRLLRHVQASEAGVPTDYGGHPLQYLAAAVEWGSEDVFLDYVTWAGAVLSARGYGVSGLASDLSAWRGFYRTRLGGRAGGRVAALLELGEQALASGQGPAPAVQERDPPPAPETGAMLDYLLAGDSARAHALFRQVARREGGPVAAGVRLVQPAMRQVGLLWQRNRISSAREHLASGVARVLLSPSPARQQPAAAEGGRRLVVACCPCNEHSLGTHLVAAAFRRTGWHVHNLGANVPIPDLLNFVHEWRPQMVAVSLSLAVHMPPAREAILRLRGEFGARRPTVMVGGRATCLFQEGWRITGADLWAPHAEAAPAEAGSTEGSA